jgi:hypothetical protein
MPSPYVGSLRYKGYFAPLSGRTSHNSIFQDHGVFCTVSYRLKFPHCDFICCPPPPRGSSWRRKFQNPREHAWQDLYTAALIELDPEKLKTLIEKAEQTIAARSGALDPTRDAEEAQRIADATRNLSVLWREAR